MTQLTRDVVRQRLSNTILLGLIVLFVGLAVLTLLPFTAPRANDLGYISMCPFAPWSTLSLLLVAGVIWPRLDIIVSGWFYDAGRGFFLADQPTFLFLHWLAVKGAWALGVLLGLLTLTAAIKREAVLGFDFKSWLFLFLTLLIGPVLIANVGLKDHWGRARPREITEFGGSAAFSPALIPQRTDHTNGSFISGDASFGFFLPSLAYVVPRNRTRRVFWIGMAAGLFFGIARIAMGGHFLSDTAFACALMLAVSAGLHAAMYGIRQTVSYWREWFYGENYG